MPTPTHPTNQPLLATPRPYLLTADANDVPERVRTPSESSIVPRGDAVVHCYTGYGCRTGSACYMPVVPARGCCQWHWHYSRHGATAPALWLARVTRRNPVSVGSRRHHRRWPCHCVITTGIAIGTANLNVTAVM